MTRLGKFPFKPSDQRSFLDLETNTGSNRGSLQTPDCTNKELELKALQRISVMCHNTGNVSWEQSLNDF